MPRAFQYDYTVFKGGQWSELQTVWAYNRAAAIVSIEHVHGLSADNEDIEIRGSDNPDDEEYIGKD